MSDVNIIDSVNSFDISSDDEEDSFLTAIRNRKTETVKKTAENKDSTSKVSINSLAGSSDANVNSSTRNVDSSAIDYDDDFIEESIDEVNAEATVIKNVDTNSANAVTSRHSSPSSTNLRTHQTDEPSAEKAGNLKASPKVPSTQDSVQRNKDELASPTNLIFSKGPSLTPTVQQSVKPHENIFVGATNEKPTHNVALESRIANLNNRIAQNAATPVRSRLEHLSSRLAESARVQAMEKRNKASAMAQTLKEVVEMNNYLNEKVSWLMENAEKSDTYSRVRNLEETVKSLNEQLEEERRLRKNNEDKYRAEFERLTSEISKAKRDMERHLDDRMSAFKSKVQDCEKSADSIQSEIINLKGMVASFGDTIIQLQQNETTVKREAADAKRLATTEKHVREEMENTLMKMLDDMFGKLRWKIDEEKKTRESTEEAILKILEDTLSRVEILE